MTETPHAFLCYGTEDRVLAEKLASAMLAKGVDVWWDEWCIGSGDSLRQKVEEGLGNCTHFIALLTPTSINKPWVNVEIDGGFMRRLGGHCRFIPLRYRLPVNQLTSLLYTMHSPEIRDNNFEADIEQLINDIHGITRKPPLGAPPAIVTETTNSNTDYSHAASAIAKIFVEKSSTATDGDPQLPIGELQEVTNLSDEDFEDALDELGDTVQVHHYFVWPHEKLFVLPTLSTLSGRDLIKTADLMPKQA
jgi:TIR domain